MAQKMNGKGNGDKKDPERNALKGRPGLPSEGTRGNQLEIDLKQNGKPAAEEGAKGPAAKLMEGESMEGPLEEETVPYCHCVFEDSFEGHMTLGESVSVGGYEFVLASIMSDGALYDINRQSDGEGLHDGCFMEMGENVLKEPEDDSKITVVLKGLDARTAKIQIKVGFLAGTVISESLSGTQG
jgi:hypothetical protein